MRVRPAEREDLVAMGRVTDAAHWEDYRELLGVATIEAMARRDLSPSTLKRRLLSGGVVVAEGDDGIVGVAHGVVADGAINVALLAVEPTSPQTEVAGSLLDALRAFDRSLPVCADVVLGNEAQERFYESAGFVPGEVLQGTLVGEDIVERRWWLSAAWSAAG